MYTSGTQFNVDPCIQCACNNGEVTCHKTKCTLDMLDGVQCAAGEKAVVKPGKCCPECVSTRCKNDFNKIVNNEDKLPGHLFLSKL